MQLRLLVTEIKILISRLRLLHESKAKTFVPGHTETKTGLQDHIFWFIAYLSLLSGVSVSADSVYKNSLADLLG